MNIKSSAKSNKKYIIIATHPRSGTHLTIDLLRKQFRDCKSWLYYGETLHHSYLNLDHLASNYSPHIDQKKAVNILNRSCRPIIKTHSHPDFNELGSENREFIQSLIQNAHIYYVVRDGRDVMCSVYLWLQQNKGDDKKSFSEFLREGRNGMSWPRMWADHVQSWLKRPDVKLLRFEENIKYTSQVLRQIGQDLGMEPLYTQPLLPKRRSNSSRWLDYWLRLTRQFENTTIVGRLSNQKPLEWQDSWSIEDRIFFQREVDDLLINLGYETSDNWIDS